MKKIILMFLLFVSTLFANIGTITLLEGEAFVKRGEETLRLNISDSISNNDFIETKTNSKVKITFMDNTIITIGKESSLKIEDYFFDSNNKNSAKSELSVSKGAFHAITGQIGKVNPEKFKLKTKNATIGIRGTEIYGDQNRVFCTQGAIFVNSFGETREVSQGFFVNTFDNQIPSQSTPIDQQQFQDVNSRLNTNSLGNNQNPNNFDNPSSPLAFQNSQSPEMNQNQDNQNSWGYWGTGPIQDENNNETISNKNSFCISDNSGKYAVFNAVGKQITKFDFSNLPSFLVVAKSLCNSASLLSFVDFLSLSIVNCLNKIYSVNALDETSNALSNCSLVKLFASNNSF